MKKNEIGANHPRDSTSVGAVGFRMRHQGHLRRLFSIIVGSVLLLCAQACGPGEDLVAVPQEISHGWARFRVDDFDQAARHFKRAIRASGERTVERAEALYGLANVFNHRRPGSDPERARELYEEVAETNPETDAAAWSLLALARLKHLENWGLSGDIPEVQAAYQRVIDLFPHHMAGEEAFLYQQSNILVTLDAEVVGRAALALEEFLQTHTQSPYICIAHHILAACYAEMGDRAARLRAKQDALEAIVDDGVTPMELEIMLNTWLVAFDAEKEVGDFETARKHYRRLIQRWPGSAFVFAAKRALESMDEVERRIRNELTAQRDSRVPEGAPPEEVRLW